MNANGIRLWCATEGDPENPALLLICGQGSQATDWDESLTAGLVAAGFFVVRYDNRDSGESTHFGGVSVDMNAVMSGDFSTVPYSLDDMAGDAIGLIDALDLDRVHLVGHSMGAMVAQVLAIHYPERVRSLTCISSTTGERSVGGYTAEVGAALYARSIAPPDQRFAAALAASSTWASFSMGVTKEQLEAKALQRLERDPEGGGGGRQLAAVAAAPNRTESLRSLDIPALVIHGTEDPLVDVSGGRATAEAIPNSRLMLIEGMRHDLPPPVIPSVTDAIVELANGAD